MNNFEKEKVHDFWNNASCGEDLYLQNTDISGYTKQAQERYRLEPYIIPFAGFKESKNKKVLEIGVGLGADHQKFAETGADLFGVDLTERAVAHTRRRLLLFGLSSALCVGDAENLKFDDSSFDHVYSWGVLHHSPKTPKAINEVYRVLKKGGTGSIMIYNKWSMVGIMLWLRYALLIGRPFRSFLDVYANHLESPGTKAYSYTQARELFCKFSHVSISSPLTHGDLLESDVGQKHRGGFLRIAKLFWPRWLIKRVLPNAGLFMMVKLRK